MTMKYPRILQSGLVMRRRDVLLAGMGVAGLAALGAGPALAEETPVQGGTLRIAQAADAQPNNILAGRAGNAIWRANVNEPLIYLDEKDNSPVPVLATHWESSEDGKSFKIWLREGVKFHTGREFTADDVVFTLDQVLVPENASQMRPLVAQLSSYEATGKYEVTITSDMPVAPRIFDVFELAVIVDKETFSGLADGSEVIGTGPFLWAEWVPGAMLRLEANADYWGEGPYLDAIEVSVISDPTAQANAMRGRVDMSLSVTPRDALMFRGDPNISLIEIGGGNIYPFGLDVTQPPFDNKTLRQAIGYAVDRERIIDQLFNGSGDPSCLWWASNQPGSASLLDYYHYDPDKARALVAEAGAEGVEVPIRAIGILGVPQIYEVVQNNLREIGLNPSGEIMETAAFDVGQTSGDLGPAFMQIHGLQGFSAATLVDAFPALRDGNASNFDPPKYRELKDKLQGATGDDYAAAVTEIGEYMLDEAFSHVLLHTQPIDARAMNVHNVVTDSVGVYMLNRTWIGM